MASSRRGSGAMAHVTFVHGIGNKPEPRALLDLRAAIAQAGAQAEGPCEPLGCLIPGLRVQSSHVNGRKHMGQVLHGSATTTEAVRRALQHSQESLRTLAKRYGINPKTVAKWKKRGSVTDLPTGPREPRSTVLSIEDEAIIVVFRQHTLLPLDDCLYALHATIPHLTRPSPP